MLKILKETPSELVVYDNGTIDTIANEPYTKVSKLFFNNKRIMYEFVPGVKVQETYNPRIFNVTYDKFRILSKQTDAGTICSAIEEHWNKGTYSKFKEYFVNVYSSEHRDEFVEEFVTNLSPLIKLEPNFKTASGNGKQPVYVIGNSFAVDAEGVSYYHRETGNDWEFLCTVVQGANQTYRIPMDNIGWITLTGKINNVISKLVFFLNPNKNDGVFTRQLRNNSPRLYLSIQTDKHIEHYQERMNDDKGYKDETPEITIAEIALIYRNLISEGNRVYKKALTDEYVMNNLISGIQKRTRAKIDKSKIKEQLAKIIKAYLEDKELSPIDLKDHEQE